MARTQRLICAAASLVDGGDGVRFELDTESGPAAAFAIRWHGQVFAYFNRCGHIPVELDWNPGKFLDDSGLYLICATHGALYEPDSGRCAGGPCRGNGLEPVEAIEYDGNIYVNLN